MIDKHRNGVMSAFAPLTTYYRTVIILMTGWTVTFVNETAKKEFQALPSDLLAKMVRLVDLIEEYGVLGLGMPHARPLTEKLWELRVRNKDGAGRSLYIAVSGRRVVVLRTFVKKTQKTPKAEIDIALRRLKESDHA